MRFISVRDFRIRPSTIWEGVKQQDMVVTSNGKPIAILTPVEENNLEEAIILLRRLRAQMALSRLRQAAATTGVNRMTTADIEAEISQARAERRR